MMDDSKKKDDYNVEFADEFTDDLFSVASATECTGLCYAPPLDDAEVESYTDVYESPLKKDTLQTTKR